MPTYPHILPTSGVIPGWGYHSAGETVLLDSETNRIVEIIPLPEEEEEAAPPKTEEHQNDTVPDTQATPPVSVPSSPIGG